MAILDSKKNGRFIKRNDPLKRSLSISEFNLAEICQTPITFHDNASASIIHEKLHLREDLAETVRNSHEIETPFASTEERMIIRPLDFTEEWARLRRRQNTRTQRNEDDEEFELDSRSNEGEGEDEEQGEPEPEQFAPGGLMDLPGQKSGTPQTPQAAPPPPVVQASPEPTPPPEPEPLFEEEYEEEASMASDSDPESEDEEDDFVPYASPKKQNVAPLERYPSEEELEAIRAAAREEGFRQGFQQGEERATIEARSKVQLILEEVSNIVLNLEGMQTSILKSAQENFHTLTQNLIESVLHKEFHLNPEAFGSIIARAVEEGLSDDEFKIFVNPKIAKELKSWSNSDLLSRVRTDDALSDYDFRVEGQHASIDASIKQIVAGLLDQVDISLFESQDKVG